VVVTSPTPPTTTANFVLRSVVWVGQDGFLIREPFCCRCHTALTEIIDHIVPAAISIMQASQSGLYPYDKYAGYFIKSNLQGLCRACHWTKTNEDKAHSGPWPSVIVVMAKQTRIQFNF